MCEENKPNYKGSQLNEFTAETKKMPGNKFFWH